MNKTKRTLHFTTDILTGRMTEEDTKKYFSRFGWFTFASFLITSVIQVILVNVIYEFFPKIYGHFLFSELISFLPMYCIAFPLAYLVIRPLPTVRPNRSKIGTGQWFQGLCICLALMLVGNYVSTFFLSYVHALTGTQTENPVEAMVGSSPMWATFLFVVILAPILEEIVFRGIVCKKLLALGEGYAIVLSSAFFALFHGNFYQLFYAFTLGCFFSFIYIKTDKLRYSILYHAAINFIGSIVAPFIVELIDIERLMDTLINPSIEGLTDVIIPLIILFVYSGTQWAAAIVGIVIAVKNRKEFKLQSGLLMPPEKKGVSCLFLNTGVAVAIAVFSLNLVSSFFAY